MSGQCLLYNKQRGHKLILLQTIPDTDSNSRTASVVLKIMPVLVRRGVVVRVCSAVQVVAPLQVSRTAVRCTSRTDEIQEALLSTARRDSGR